MSKQAVVGQRKQHHLYCDYKHHFVSYSEFLARKSIRVQIFIFLKIFSELLVRDVLQSRAAGPRVIYHIKYIIKFSLAKEKDLLSHEKVFSILHLLLMTVANQ